VCDGILCAQAASALLPLALRYCCLAAIAPQLSPRSLCSLFAVAAAQSLPLLALAALAAATMLARRV
jgi:hypothetical protein